MLYARGGADIRITGDKSELAEVERLLKPMLTFDNPDYQKKVRLGKWIGNTPRQISLYRRDGDAIVLPFGMLPWVFQHKKLFACVENAIGPLRSFDYKSAITLYPYQEKAVEAALKARQGVVVAPCGAGKTQIGLELIAKIGGRALWITHTHDLLRQSMERAQSVFGCSAKTFGTITGGKVSIGESLTFSTVQTLSRVDLDGIRNSFDVIIVDEAHHCVGTPARVTMFSKVLSALSARYKYGLTATPKRADGLTPCMYALLGEKVYEIDRADVSETTCPVRVEFWPTEFRPEYEKIIMPDGTLSYSNLISEVVRDAGRNDLILGAMKTCEYPCLVLTDRVEHLDVLYKRAEYADIPAAYVHGVMSKSTRAAIFDMLSSGKIKILFGTFALAREGLDIPQLRTLILATPQKNETVSIQAAGRVARRSPGKSEGKIIDFSDRLFPMLGGWTQKRGALYRKMGFRSTDGSF